MAAKTNCSQLIAKVVALETGLDALRQVLDERDERYKQRAHSQDAAVATALAAAEKAVVKAEAATERRLEGLNELRDMNLDQAKTFARTDEVNLLIKAIEVRIQSLDDLAKSDLARGGGMQEAWGYFAVALGLIIAALAVYFRH